MMVGGGIVGFELWIVQYARAGPKCALESCCRDLGSGLRARCCSCALLSPKLLEPLVASLAWAGQDGGRDSMESQSKICWRYKYRSPKRRLPREEAK